MFWMLVYIIGQYSPFREKVRVGPFLIICQTERFNQILRRLSFKLRKLCHHLGTFGIFFAFFVIFHTFYTLAENIVNFWLFPIEKASPVFPLIPLVTISLRFLPYFIVAAMIAIIVHEAAHAFVLHAENVGIKSVGLFLVFLFPGAFVEEDKEKLREANFATKLRVYSSGCIANIALAFLVLSLITNFYAPTGIVVADVIENSPAFGTLKAGDTILAINGTLTSSRFLFTRYMSQIRPGYTLNITIQRSDSHQQLFLRTGRHPKNESQGFIGIVLDPYSNYSPKLPLPGPHREIYITAHWTYFISLFAGITNLLPIYPLDGHFFVISIVEKCGERLKKVMSLILSFTAGGLLLANIILTLINFGLIRL
jgi:membrane-associated protease RseP (regulator of RpoE activity)